jgi:transcriptional regulator with XRE-family HTH domain
MSNENLLHSNERLRRERIQRGWSQQKLADQLGIAVVTVNRWERGKQQPTGYYRLKLVALFEKSAEELGLVGELAEATSPVASKEPQGNDSDIVPASLSEQEDQVRDTRPSFYEAVEEQPSLVQETGQQSLPFFPHAQSNALQHRRGRMMRLFLILALFITVVSITFSIVRLNSTNPPTEHKRPAQVVSAYPLPMQNPGKLVLDDPLTKAGGDSQWQIGGGICQFTHNALQIISTGTNYCSANIQPFDNMTFQIEMSVQKGIWAGITFRADDNSSLYYFSISVHGQYKLDRLKHNSLLVTLLSGNSSAIHTGYNQINILTVEANKTQLSFWVNTIWLKQTHDTFFKEGYVGIGASSYEDTTDTLVEATFNNARVWQL